MYIHTLYIHTYTLYLRKHMHINYIHHFKVINKKLNHKVKVKMKIMLF